ncbi:MAG: class I SAM-dependent methyltransferase, partial [Actinobacteria bacterium]|nr:class I SAM-dependent methyltransferase [Actinomycetota bacterium]
VNFYVSLAEAARGPIVELAVGTGRVAIPVTQRTGRRVIGIDLSPAMLSVARSKAAAAGVELELRVGDMRELQLDEATDLVICPGRSMLHLESHEERVLVMRRVARVLVPGGRFAWNAFVFDPEVAAEIGGIWRDENGIRNRSSYDEAERRIALELEGGAIVHLWWVDRGEWQAAVAEAGLEVEALYGWFDRRPFDAESREFVYVTRKPGP